MHPSVLIVLRKQRFRLLLVAFAFLAVGCAHHHDNREPERIRPANPTLGGF